MKLRVDEPAQVGNQIASIGRFVRGRDTLHRRPDDPWKVVHILDASHSSERCKASRKHKLVIVHDLAKAGKPRDDERQRRIEPTPA
jgi:hypothetical protein